VEAASNPPAGCRGLATALANEAGVTGVGSHPSVELVSRLPGSTNVVLVRARSPGGDVASVIDATVIATGLGLLSWVFLVKPAATDGSLTILGRVASIAYPTADVLLLALLARLGGSASPPPTGRRPDLVRRPRPRRNGVDPLATVVGAVAEGSRPATQRQDPWPLGDAVW
jgi:hypothetical protein